MQEIALEKSICGRALERTAVLFEESQNQIHRRADRLFSNLMVAQWLAGIAAALWISPKTWIGAASQTHGHVWAAIFLGGAIAGYPVYLAWKHPGRLLTRHIIAVAQMLTSALLIHLTGGRIETHFHIFGSLAFLAFYRDWRVLLTATVVVALDHMARGLLWPQSVFGVLTASPWRWLEHAGWVVFEDTFLFISIRQSLSDMLDVATRRAKLETLNAEIENLVAERTAELTAAHQKLQTSEQLMRVIFESEPECVKLIAADGTVLDMNPAGLTVVEADHREQVIGQSVYGLLVPEHRELFRAMNEAVFQGEAKTAGFEIIGLKGTRRMMETHACPLRDAEGRIFAQLAITRDVSERKQAEVELSHQRHLLQSLMDYSPDHIYFKDLESRFLNCSEFLAARLGLKNRAEAVGKSDFDFFNEEHARRAFEDEQEIIRTGQPVLNKIEKEFWTSTGKTSWSLTNKMPLRNPAGEIIGTFGISKDVTEQKDKEEELRRTQAFLNSVVENLPIGVFIKEAKEMRFVLWSKGNEELIGISRAEIMGKNDHDLFTKEEADAFTANDRKTLEHGHQVNVAEETIQTRHHGQRTLLTRKVPILDENGQPAYLLGISEDITERKLAEAELEQAQKKLVDTSHQAGMAEVATGVLHNVGNVLNSVNVSATLVMDHLKKSKAGSLTRVVAMLHEHAADLGAFLAGDPKGKQLPAYLEQLAGHLANEQIVSIKELELLRQNIDHIKDIVAMQQSYAKVSGVLETVKVIDLIEDALRMNAGALVRHDVQLVREYHEHAPEITVEKHKVLQILVNLIRNAKYACDESNRHDKRLTVRVTNGDDRVRIAVADNGMGIPPENLTRIFAHGFTTKKDGHGFGLHSGALAAKELGGALHVHSEGSNRGATFTLELPIEKKSEELLCNA